MLKTMCWGTPILSGVVLNQALESYLFKKNLNASKPSVLIADDDTTFAVSPTRGWGNEKKYRMRNHRRNAYASLKVWMLWLDCLSITTVHGGCMQPTRGYTRRIHLTFGESSSSYPP